MTELLTQTLDRDRLNIAFYAIHAIKHPLRQALLRIVEKKTKQSAGDLRIAINKYINDREHELSQVRLSQELAPLIQCGIITQYKDGQKRHYAINRKKLKAWNEAIEKLCK